jgi:hypothetical protein
MLAHLRRFQVRQLASLLPLVAALSCAGTQSQVQNQQPVLTVAWPVDNLSKIGGYRVRVVGTPDVKNEAPGKAVCFSGTDDGLAVPINPLDMQLGFTIQLLVKPSAGGGVVQQLLHLQDGESGRVIIESRAIAGGKWRLHSFVKFGEQQQDLETDFAAHPMDQWYWVALTYSDDGMVRQYVNGEEEAAASLPLEPMKAGEMGIGFKLSEENYFRGCVRELRFANAGLPVTRLEQATPSGTKG